MSTEQRDQAARRPAPADQKDRPAQPGEQAEPITTGDMQKVGALTPEEAKKRREVTPDEPPVEESPGDQFSG